jgi:hypothetical protein
MSQWTARIVAAGVMSALALQAQAAIVGDYTNRFITSVYTYTTHGGGDVTFQVNAAIAGCEGGLWISPADAGFKVNVATVLLSYSSRVPQRPVVERLQRTNLPALRGRNCLLTEAKEQTW